MKDIRCEFGFGQCKAPDTNCPHWQGTFCELDIYIDEDYNKNILNTYDRGNI